MQARRQTDDAAGEHVHDDQHPVTAQQNRFAAKQINRAQASQVRCAVYRRRRPEGLKSKVVYEPEWQVGG